jgi:ABC-type transporter Mla subunit MlaD
MKIDSAEAPLDRGTRAVVRQTSLSGIANRYVDLQLPRGETGKQIADGGEIPLDRSKGAVEIDEVYDIFDPRQPEHRAGQPGDRRQRCACTGRPALRALRLASALSIGV